MDLVNTRTVPPWTGYVREQSRRARAYHSLRPYPNHSPVVLKDWKTDERGPVPKCRPFVRRMARRHADWLFGKPLSLNCGDKEKLTETVNGVWSEQRMQPRMKAGAESAFQSGNLVLKFRHDDDKKVGIDVLDIEHVRLYYNPHEAGVLLMARIQYPFFDYETREWMWYREEWTEDKYVTYEPMASEKPKSNHDPNWFAEEMDQSERWKVKASEENKYGLIPVQHIKNLDVGAEFGLGDLWTLWDAIDECNFTYDLCNKDNQKSVDPKKYLIDGAVEEDEAPVAGPDSVESIESTNPNLQAKLQFYENQGSLREHIQKHADELKRDILLAVGDVDVDPAEVSNKGSLTTAVLAQLYAPLIEAIDDKRTQYGEYGIAAFFEKMCKGMARAKVEGFEWSEGLDVQVEWPAYFDMGEEEKLTRVQRFTAMEAADLTTHERAVRECASLDGDTDVEQLVQDATKQREERNEREKELTQPAASQNKGGEDK